MRGDFRRHAMPLVGIGYLCAIAGLVACSILVYAKAMPWQRAVSVTLQTARPGLELHPHSDVKIQGVRVGEVRSIVSNGRSATVELALDPDRTDLIPRNVDAAILPKTLFGEKYVDLRPPERPSEQPIEEGDVIRQSTTSIEIGELFTNLTATLRTLKPERLSLALNSLADALEGRGVQLGETLELLDRYLGGLNPHLDTLTRDIQLFAETANIYAAAAPDLLRTLADSGRISSELLVPEERSFEEFLDAVIQSADTTTAVLRRNADTLVKLNDRSEGVLALFAHYSSSFPCTVHAFAVADRAANHVAGAQGPFVKLSLDRFTRRQPYRYPEDSPGNGTSDANNGNLPAPVPNWDPHCPYLPTRFRNLKQVPPYWQMAPGLNPMPPQGSDRPRSDVGLPDLLTGLLDSDAERGSQ